MRVAIEVRALTAMLRREWRDLRGLLLVLAAIPVLMTAFECAFPSLAPLPAGSARIVLPAMLGLFLVVVGSASFAGMPGRALDGRLLAPVGSTRLWLAKLANLALLGALFAIWSVGLEAASTAWREGYAVLREFLGWIPGAQGAYLLAIAAGCGAAWLAAALRSSFQAALISLIPIGLLAWLAVGARFDEAFWLDLRWAPPEKTFTGGEVHLVLVGACAVFLAASRISFSPWRHTASRRRWRMARGLGLPALFLGSPATWADVRLSWAWSDFGFSDPRVKVMSADPCPDGRQVVITFGVRSPIESYRVRFLDLETGEVRAQPRLPVPCNWYGDGPDGSVLILGRDQIYQVDPDTLEMSPVESRLPSEDRKAWRERLGLPPLVGSWGEVERPFGVGTGRFLVRWGDREYELDVVPGTMSRCRCGSEPGIVFYSSTDQGLVRLDLETGERRILVPAETDPPLWSLSREGRYVAVTRMSWTSSIHRAEDGSLVAGPWDDCMAGWAHAQEEDRYVQLNAKDRSSTRILDLMEGRTAALEASIEHSFTTVLRDGRVLVSSGRHVDLLDRDGRFLRTIWPPQE